MATMTAQQFIDYVKKPELAKKFANEVLALLKPEPKKKAETTKKEAEAEEEK